MMHAVVSDRVLLCGIQFNIPVVTSVQFTDLMALLNKIWEHPQRGPKAEEALAPYLLSSLGIEHKPPRGKVPSRWLLFVFRPPGG